MSVAPAALRALAYHYPQDFPVLLDSSATGPLGRFSILGAFPQGALWLDGQGRLHTSGGPPRAGGFLDTLQDAWHRERVQWLASAPVLTPAARCTPLAAPAPFAGGWFVFLGYEIAGEIEPQLRLPRANAAMAAAPLALALRVPAAVAYDHCTGSGWLIAEPGHAELIEALAQALERALDLMPTESTPAPGASSRLGAPRSDGIPVSVQLEEEGEELFRVRVETALDYIRAGDVYQANLSRPWRGECRLLGRDACQSAHAPDDAETTALTAALYERLRSTNPAPFAALLQYADWRLLCSSPERLVQVHAGCVQTRPIAGTRPRSLAMGQDALERAALVAHPKERAEHVMLIDLARNDLGRFCEAGSVRVDEMMITETYAHVHHIVSNVTGRLQPGRTPVDVLRAIFPGGTITGCPKYRCMQIIAELEGEARGAYTGALGFMNHDGSMDFNILIRSLTLHGRRVQFRTGAGIVADSNWRRELAETRAKARGLLAALGPSGV